MRVKLSLLAAAAVLLLTIATVMASAVPESTLTAPTLAAYGDDDDDGSPREGRRVFLRENCYGCHGGRAGGGMCPSLREERPDEDEVRRVVRNGTPNGMPPYPHLTEKDIRNLAAYFDTLRDDDDEPTFTHWWEPFPTR